MTLSYSTQNLRGKVPAVFLSTLEYATSRYEVAKEKLKHQASAENKEATRIIQEANDAYMVWKKANQLIAEYLGEKINGKR